MKCSISVCGRDAVVLVTFRHSRKGHGFCGYHAYDRRGRLRWDSKHVRNVLRRGASR